jgi:uncharacterized caspase-like protein
MIKLRTIALALAALASAAMMCITDARAERRLALVVGNDRYESLEPLQKAVNDARSVGAALQKIGFEVIKVENATRRVFSQKLAEFTAKVGRGDTALCRTRR